MRKVWLASLMIVMALILGACSGGNIAEKSGKDDGQASGAPQDKDQPLFDPASLAKTADSLVLGVKWLGAEGESDSFLSLKESKFTKLDVGYGRYMSPL